MLRKLMLTCEEVAYLVSQSFDRKLPPVKRMQVRLHHLLCTVCGRNKDQITLVRMFTKKASSRLTPPVTLSQQSKEKLKAFLSDLDISELPAN